MAHIDPHLPFDLDARDPDFVRKCNVWAAQTQCDMQELVGATKKVIAASRTLITEVDLLLARR